MSLEFASDLAPARFTRRVVRTAGVTGLGGAVPEQVIDNVIIGAGAGVTPEWIVKRTGIATRRHLRPEERLDALAATAGAEALAQAGLPASALDAVLVGTSTADEVYPQAAPLVAALLGAGSAMAWDTSLACTGFLAVLAQGAALIESGRATHVLALGADAVSRNVDPSDKGPAAPSPTGRAPRSSASAAPAGSARPSSAATVSTARTSLRSVPTASSP